MRIKRIKTILCILMLCLAGCTDPSKDVLTYTLELKPGMKIEKVKALFPKNMHWIDKQADETKQNCWMDRRYSSKAVSRRLVFLESEHGYRATTVYFDEDGKLIGIYFSGSSGSQLEKDELRFPGELIQCRWGGLHWHKTQEDFKNCQQRHEKNTPKVAPDS